MGKVHEIFTGKELTQEEIKKLEDEKNSVKPITPDEQKELVNKAEEMAEEIMKKNEIADKIEKNKPEDKK